MTSMGRDFLEVFFFHLEGPTSNCKLEGKLELCKFIVMQTGEQLGRCRYGIKNCGGVFFSLVAVSAGSGALRENTSGLENVFKYGPR